MLDTILTIAFFILIFGFVAFVIYKWTKNINKKSVPNFGLKNPGKHGCCH